MTPKAAPKNPGRGQSLAPWLIFALALAIRSLQWTSVLVADRVIFFGNDAYYHMRRILYALGRFPETLEFDRYVNFPQGAKVIWPPLFDVAIALLLRPFHQPSNEDLVERIVIWIPPLLGALTVLVLFFLAKRTFGFAVAVVSSLILSVLSAHAWYSQIGFVDHHAAVALFSTLLLASAMDLFSELSIGRDNRTNIFAKAALMAIMAGVILLLWPGAILYVVMVQIGLLLLLLTRATREEARRVARVLALANAISFAIIFPFSAFNTWPQWSEFSSVVLSRFQPWFFGVLAIYGLACTLLWELPRLANRGMTLRARAIQAVAVGAVALGASALFFPELLLATSDAWQWMTQANDFQSMVTESRPLLLVQDRLGVEIAELRLSRFLYLFPPAAVALAWTTRERSDRAALLLFLAWSVTLCTITFLQKRFFNTFSVALALTAGWSCVWAYRTLTKRLSAKLPRQLVVVLLTTSSLWLLWPTLRAYGPALDNQIRVLRGEPVALRPYEIKKLVLQQAAEWLREHTPETSGFFDATQEPEYGILASWDYGHMIKYLARRPTVLGNFGDDVGVMNFTRGRRVFDSSRREAAARLEELRVRYLIVGPDSEWRPLEKQLYDGNGSGMGRFRLLYESVLPELSERRRFKIFEFVRGAVVVGRAPEGQRVMANLSLLTNLGERALFKVSTIADANQKYRFRLPYANRGSPEAVRTAPEYLISSSGDQTVISISERQVQTGAQVAGPNFSK
jgi:dolichyl-diphosphooligosaccharide--protein glycosyltransferase